MFRAEYEKYQSFLSENFPSLVVKFSVYLNRRVFVMSTLTCPEGTFSLGAAHIPPVNIMKISLFKYNTNFTTKNMKKKKIK